MHELKFYLKSGSVSTGKALGRTPRRHHPVQNLSERDGSANMRGRRHGQSVESERLAPEHVGIPWSSNLLRRLVVRWFAGGLRIPVKNPDKVSGTQRPWGNMERSLATSFGR